MRDRFKFRIWWKKEECWVESMMLCDMGFLAMQNGTDIEEDGFDEKDLIIQQCTGLKDKNGKLIYEGDILKVAGKQTEEVIGCVQWLDDFCKFSLNITNSKEGKYQSCETFCEFDYLPEAERKIIGNIYENKKLLGEDKC